MRVARLLPLACLLVAGCASGDGVRAAPTPTKAEIQKQIDGVKANRQIPDVPKQRILDGLNEQMRAAH